MNHQLKIQEERKDGVVLAMYSNTDTGFFCVQTFANRQHMEEHAVRHRIRVIEDLPPESNPFAGS